MSLRLKLVVIILLVGLVPLGISAWTTLSLHQRALEERTGELHRKAAEYGAATVQAHLDRTRASLSQAVRAIAWDALTPAERDGALWLIYKQVEEIAVVSLLDEAGRGLGPSAYLMAGAPEEAELAGHPRPSLQLLSVFSGRIPFMAARQGAFASGEVFAGREVEAPLLPVAVPVRGAKGAGWVIAAAVSLAPLCRAVAAVSARGATSFLLDERQRVLCHPGAPAQLSVADAELLRATALPPGTTAERLVHFRSESGEERIAAVAGTPSGWSVVVEQPAAVAYAANTRMRGQALVWLALALVVSVGTGLLLSRNILRPVRRLLEGARLLAQGRFEHRLAVDSRDELGQLSEAFNHMGAEVQTRDREIRAFNDELQQRVEQRTRELREAQEQLLHSQKMAAVTGLGAGFAHELNNPLTAVLGLSQILYQRLEGRAERQEEALVLKCIQTEAHRIRKVVRELLSLSQSYGGESFSELEVHELIDDSILMVQQKLGEAQVEVVRRFHGGLPKVRGNATQLREVLVHLFNNSRAAMASAGGTLTVSTGVVGGHAVRIEVADTGRGIAPEHLPKVFDPFFTTKDEWRSEGLGLTLASRVVEQHKGRIQIQSEMGKGTTLTITLPAAPSGTHLA